MKRFSYLLLAVGAMSAAVSCAPGDDIAAKNGVVVWSMENIDRKAEAIRGGESDGSYDELVRLADSIILTPNPSVMTKPESAKSGDMHDYVSLARYMWPNPDTANGLPYIPRDGLSNPELDKYDRNRLGEMCMSVNNLALVYYVSGEQKYADKAVSRLNTWFVDPETRMNPNLNYSQLKKGIYDTGTPSGLIDGYSFVEMLDAVKLLEVKRALPEETSVAIKKWFADLSLWMESSKQGERENRSTNNHGIAYDAQIIRYAMYGECDTLALRVINAFPERRLAAQVREDGRQPRELARKIAFHYVNYNLEHMVDIAGMARSYDIDIYSSANRAIERAIDWTIPYTFDPDSFTWDQINSWQVVQDAFSRVVRRASFFGKSDEYQKYYEKMGAKPELPLFDFIYN